MLSKLPVVAIRICEHRPNKDKHCQRVQDKDKDEYNDDDENNDDEDDNPKQFDNNCDNI